MCASKPIPNDQLRVLHIITRMILGGAQENTLLSVEGLSQLPKYNVTLLSGVDNGPEGDLLSRAKRTVNLTILPDMRRNIAPLSDMVTLWKLCRVIRRGKYHIVHTHSAKGGVLGRLAAWLVGTPIIIHTHHGLAFHDYQHWLVNRAWRTIEQLSTRISHHLISVSELLIDKAVDANIAPRDKFSTIYSGMELDWFTKTNADANAVKKEFNIPHDSPIIGKIARLFPLKGHDQLLDAAPVIVRNNPKVRFFLVGDGILQQHLKERARQQGILDNFIFAGLVPRERIPEMIAVMDVVVHTSLREGLARVLPQALAMGKPCVSFAIDGAPEVVIPDETGYLIEPNDSDGLAKAVSKLVNDPQLCQRMGEAGRKRVDPAFRAETMVHQIAEVYRDMCQKHKERIVRFNERQLLSRNPIAVSTSSSH